MKRADNGADVPNGPMAAASPNYEGWGKKDLWTAHQSACLLINIEPIAEAGLRASKDWQQYESTKSLIDKEVGKSLKYFHANFSETRFLPYVVIEWAESKDIPVPPPLKFALLESWPSKFRTGCFIDAMRELRREIQRLDSELVEKRKESIPPYLSPEHPRFAPELCAAVKVWNAHFVDGQFKDKRAVKLQLAHWLERKGKEASGNGRDFSKAAVERIAIVANPLKAGGAPRSE